MSDLTEFQAQAVEMFSGDTSLFSDFIYTPPGTAGNEQYDEETDTFTNADGTPENFKVFELDYQAFELSNSVKITDRKILFPVSFLTIEAATDAKATLDTKAMDIIATKQIGKVLWELQLRAPV